MHNAISIVMTSLNLATWHFNTYQITQRCHTQFVSDVRRQRDVIDVDAGEDDGGQHARVGVVVTREQTQDVVFRRVTHCKQTATDVSVTSRKNRHRMS